MKDTTTKYELRVLTSKGWEKADVKLAVTRMDYLHLAYTLTAYGVQACVYTVTTTVDTRLIYQNWQDQDED